MTAVRGRGKEVTFEMRMMLIDYSSGIHTCYSHKITLTFILGAYLIALKASSLWAPLIRDPAWQIGRRSRLGRLVL